MPCQRSNPAHVEGGRIFLSPATFNIAFPSLSVPRAKMPLRPLDNALPSAEQTKKVAKVAASPSLSAKKAAAALATASSMNDENMPNPSPPEQSVEYVPSEDLAALMDPESKMCCWRS
ncbi:uncharacterized protein LOC122014325 [Zingiber officinale]|uniref:uncharacterized protein LOC122014325 n=1 Tax=Zingiber officinale TaxID=94328 RepID=UPI001C4D6844|nr:uncharacterized protein LOC122014325 [Zingiber officinale]